MKGSKAIADILRRHPFFKELKPKHLKLLAENAVEAAFPEKASLLRAGEEADRFFLIREGRVSIELPTVQRHTVTLRTLDPGDVLGWSWLVPPHRWHFSASAIQPVSVLSFDARSILRVIADDHELGYELLQRFSAIMANRLEETLPQIIGISS